MANFLSPLPNRGIVSEEELERVKQAIANHSLIDGQPGGFRTWKEHKGGEESIWLEVDVNQNLIEYLEGSGFFDPFPATEVAVRTLSRS